MHRELTAARNLFLCLCKSCALHLICELGRTLAYTTRRGATGQPQHLKIVLHSLPLAKLSIHFHGMLVLFKISQSLQWRFLGVPDQRPHLPAQVAAANGRQES